MLTCQQLVELVTDYLEGRLSTWDRARFQMHVAMCGHCRAYLDQMRVTVDALGHVPEVELPEDVQADLLARFASWKEDRNDT